MRSVLVHGTYSKSLTIAAETDVVINGEILPTGVTAGNPPTGTATLGLMASRFVRIYHPVLGWRQRIGLSQQPLDLRRAPFDEPLLPGGQLQLWLPTRQIERLRCDRAEVPRPCRHRRRQRLPQES